MTYFFETYGCQMNKAESAALELVLKERGWTASPHSDTADLVLVNTCSVRATAETRVMGRLAHFSALKKKRPFSLVVAGCMAERLQEDLLRRVPAVDQVMGTTSRSIFPALLEAMEKGLPLDGESAPFPDEKPVFSFSASHLEEGAFRSFVPIMHGCDNFCSYCIVPYVRGRETSRSPSAILAEIAMLEAKGVREITLLGQNVNSYRYQEDGKTTDFPALLEQVAGAVHNIRWVRFLSSHPKDFSPALIGILKAHPVLSRHIHLCVQHGSNRILEAMNRRYTRERYLELVDMLRNALPDSTLSTDLLMGFPGETEEDVQDTLDLMRRVRFASAYMYHYNPREGTAAYSLEGRIPDEVKKERLSRVMAEQTRITRELMRERVGVHEMVLVEAVSKKNPDELLARTQRDEMLVFTGSASLIGTFMDASLTSLRGSTFRATEVKPCSGV